MTDREYKIVDYFCKNPESTILQVSSATEISKSSVQRCLNKPDISNIEIPGLNCTIKEQLQKNLLKGRQKGGRNTFNTHDSIKDEHGHFIGLKPTTSSDKENIKKEDIKILVGFFSHHPFYTLDQIAIELDNKYTSDYIYNCLTDPRVKEIFGEVIASAIEKQLSDNKYGILKKYGDYFNETLFEQAELTPEEIQVLKMRFDGETIKSAEAVAVKLGISKTMVTKIEDRALEKIEQYQECQKKR